MTTGNDVDVQQRTPETTKKERWIEGKRVRVFFWAMWILVSGVAVILAVISIVENIKNESLKPSQHWDLINVVSLCFVAYTILSVMITHRVDEARKGWGIRDAYKTRREPDKSAMVTQTGIISAIMGRQAIHNAIALGLLVVIFQRGFLDPGKDVTKLSDALKNFKMCVAWLVTGGFALSVVLILVSALCYDYSCRFKWTDDLKLSLIRKGLSLDIWSWYAFTVSLILSITLVSPLLCILVNAGYGFLLLYYYFFALPRTDQLAIFTPD